MLYAPRGPLVTEVDPPRKALDDTIKQVAMWTRAGLLRVSPGADISRRDIYAGLISNGFMRRREDWTIWNAPKVVMTRRSNPPARQYGAASANFRRREIKAAQAAGVTIVEAPDADDLRTVYRFLVEMGRRKDYPVRLRRHFEAVWREYRAASSAVLLVARHRGEAVGGLLGARLGRKAYYLYSAVGRPSEADSTHRPGPLLH